MLDTRRRFRPGIVPAALALALVVAGCAGDSTDSYKEEPVADLYNKAMDRMEGGDYKEAAESFDEVERQHPYSVWATKAQLMAGYAHYEANQYDEAIIALDRFIELHPGNEDIAYAHYLKALCYYERISDVARDQKMTRQARDALKRVVRRFPESDYARDARIKLDLTRDHLAGKYMTIGRFYEQKQHYLAAIKRYRTVVKKFQTTSHVPEALHRLVETYRALGMMAQARRAAAVLGHNYPGSEWYQRSYRLLKKNVARAEGEDSWLGLPF